MYVHLKNTVSAVSNIVVIHNRPSIIEA
jgi:hypothetical protein